MAGLRIAVIAHVRFPICAPFMGGMEAHCHTLCRGLAERGHEVTLFAAPGSATAARLHPIGPAHYEAVLPWKDWHGTPELHAFQASAYAQAMDAIRAGGFDVVHNNTLFPDLIGWATEGGVPMLTSQHVPPFGRMHDAVIAAAGDMRAQISVTSASQMPLWFAHAPANLSVVHNGIDTAAWVPAPRHERLVWSGRITPNKGTGEALRAAHLAGVPLDICGVIEDEVYFAEKVAPLLDRERRYLGHLTQADLRRTIASAAALVVTPMWPEPFGLVAAEALSADVPVIAFDAGAMREVVGPAGRLVAAGDVAALADVMRDPPALPPGTARRRALDRFSIAAMIAVYEALYARAMAAARLREPA